MLSMFTCLPYNRKVAEFRLSLRAIAVERNCYHPGCADNAAVQSRKTVIAYFLSRPKQSLPSWLRSADNGDSYNIGVYYSV